MGGHGSWRRPLPCPRRCASRDRAGTRAAAGASASTSAGGWPCWAAGRGRAPPGAPRAARCAAGRGGGTRGRPLSTLLRQGRACPAPFPSPPRPLTPPSPAGHHPDRGPAGVRGRGQGRAPPPPAEVRRVHQRLPRLPGPERAFLAECDFGGPGLEVTTLLRADSAQCLSSSAFPLGFRGRWPATPGLMASESSPGGLPPGGHNQPRDERTNPGGQSDCPHLRTCISEALETTSGRGRLLQPSLQEAIWRGLGDRAEWGLPGEPSGLPGESAHICHGRASLGQAAVGGLGGVWCSHRPHLWSLGHDQQLCRPGCKGSGLGSLASGGNWAPAWVGSGIGWDQGASRKVPA